VKKIITQKLGLFRNFLKASPKDIAQNDKYFKASAEIRFAKNDPLGGISKKTN
jgi:hypothetical protein